MLRWLPWLNVIAGHTLSVCYLCQTEPSELDSTVKSKLDFFGLMHIEPAISTRSVSKTRCSWGNQD